MSSERRKLVRGASWTLASTLVALLVGAILNPLLVFYVGVDGYGIWASAIAIASLLGLGGDLGVAGALTKFVAERRGQGQDAGSLARSALTYGLLAGVVAGLALAILSLFMDRYVNYDRFPLLLQLQAIQMPINLGTSSLVGLRQGRRQFRTIALFSITQAVASLLLALALLTLGFGIPGVMIASLSASGFVFGALLYSSRADLRFSRPVGLRSDFRRLIPFGLNLAGTNALSVVLYEVDIVALSLIVRDPRIIGAYALAVFITRALWILPSSIGTTTYPTISEYFAAGEHRRASKYLSTALAASVATIGSLTCGLILFGRPLLQLVFGPDSLPAFDYALFLVPGTAVLGCLRSVASSIPGSGRPDIGFRISAFGAGLLLFLSVTMTLMWGVLGTATAVSVTFILVGVALARSINRFVIRGEGGLLSSNRVRFPALVGFVASGLALLVAVSFVFDLTRSIAFLLIWIVVSATLVLTSGGKETWGTFFQTFRPSPAERS
jgi:O-antigen/teichoic acid export membrane protein